MINIPFLLRIVMQVIEILVSSGLLGDNDRQTLTSIADDVKRLRKK